MIFYQYEETWLADPDVAAQAATKRCINFRLVFKRMLDDPEFQVTLMDLYATKVYRRAPSNTTPEAQ